MSPVFGLNWISVINTKYQQAGFAREKFGTVGGDRGATKSFCQLFQT